MSNSKKIKLNQPGWFFLQLLCKPKSFHYNKIKTTWVLGIMDCDYDTCIIENQPPMKQKYEKPITECWNGTLTFCRNFIRPIVELRWRWLSLPPPIERERSLPRCGLFMHLLLQRRVGLSFGRKILVWRALYTRQFYHLSSIFFFSFTF